MQWVIPEKIHTPTTEGMLENLTGGGVNGSGNPDGRGALQTFQPLLRRNREALLAPKALRRAPTARASRGVWGHAPPGNFANLVSLKWHFLHFDIIFVVFFKVLDSEKMD